MHENNADKFFFTQLYPHGCTLNLALHLPHGGTIHFLIGAACGPFAAATSSPPAGSPTERAHPGPSALCEALCELMGVVLSDLTVEAMREDPSLVPHPMSRRGRRRNLVGWRMAWVGLAWPRVGLTMLSRDRHLPRSGAAARARVRAGSLGTT